MRTFTASLRFSSLVTTDILISDVEIMLILILFFARTENILLAMPA